MADEEQSMTIPEFAALCREKCAKPAQREGAKCGDQGEVDGEPSWTFCGVHFAAVLGVD